jgi:hypothetical protein
MGYSVTVKALSHTLHHRRHQLSFESSPTKTIKSYSEKNLTSAQ